MRNVNEKMSGTVSEYFSEFLERATLGYVTPMLVTPAITSAEAAKVQACCAFQSVLESHKYEPEE